MPLPSIPFTLLATLPLPTVATVSRFTAVKVAVTFGELPEVTVTTQVPVPSQPLPPQPAKIEPAAALALSVTSETSTAAKATAAAQAGETT